MGVLETDGMARINTRRVDAVMASICDGSIEYVVTYKRRCIAASDGLFWTIGMKQKNVVRMLSRGKRYVIVYRPREIELGATALTQEIQRMFYA